MFQFKVLGGDARADAPPWISLSTIGASAHEVSPSPEVDYADRTIAGDIDTFNIRAPLASTRMQLRVWADDPSSFLRSPCLATISILRSPTAPKIVSSFGLIDLPVPQESQMDQSESIRRRICSPTNVSMVLQYFGVKASVTEVANLAYHRQHDMFGVWPANIWAASRWGVLGCVIEIESWACVANILESGVPLIASINYKRGELSNAAIPETPGHLVTVRGLRDAFVRVNDPAAQATEAVEREYAIDEFDQVWLQRKRVAYVLLNTVSTSHRSTKG